MEKSAEAGTAIREGAVRVLGEADRPITMAELVAGIDLEYATPAKVAYYIKALVDDGTVVKVPEKVDNRKIMTYALG